MRSILKESTRNLKSPILSFRRKILSAPLTSTICSRPYHVTLSTFTWRTRFRPELKENKHWTLEKGTEEYKESLKKNLFWYREVDSDELFKSVSKDLVEGGTIRPGILNVLLYKAQTVEHLSVIMQAMSWLQAKFSYDMDSDIAGRLCKAAYRARSPETALKIIESPLVRVWPSSNNVFQLVSYFTEEAEKIVFKTPLIHDYNEKANVEDPTLESLVKRFAIIENFIKNDDYEIEKSPSLTYSLAKFYALTNSYDKMIENFKYFRTKQAEDSIILTYYIAMKDWTKAKKYIEEIQRDESLPKTFISLSVLVYLELGEEQKAIDAIKSLDNIPLSLLKSHLGHKDRFLKITNALESVVNEKVIKGKGFDDYKKIVEAYLDRQVLSSQEEKAEGEEGGEENSNKEE